jgi:hypothetical protein
MVAAALVRAEPASRAADETEVSERNERREKLAMAHLLV